MQRVFDILLSGFALLVFLPLMLPVMLALRLSGEGEVFFVQSRIGRHGRPFGLYKFATMLRDSPSMGTGTVTLKDDPRVLPMGRFLRRYKINELPQLLNVLRGDMSLVGPRPQTTRCFEAYPERSRAAILQVPPGMSGIGAIVFHDEEQLLQDGAAEDLYDRVIMPYKGLIEEWYVARRGLRVYLACLALTVWVVLRPRSGAVWTLFPDLPPPPPELAAPLAWRDRR
ncbi:sugar transferase [Arenimonas composti]|uniref:Bacterial sugar transferase domain-containing protein n=1 Tax=Arenimonas composti TR7-09 = DSM 18010 TaxID=1121013 RepID=A0A091BKY5_9GAMM|nr:sugar transferase [Arenimonas composti]KFN51434.1 hypothetical protein P873_02560 [Arenimonas composti TR7-09 = DSM 18010]